MAMFSTYPVHAAGQGKVELVVNYHSQQQCYEEAQYALMTHGYDSYMLGADHLVFLNKGGGTTGLKLTCGHDHHAIVEGFGPRIDNKNVKREASHAIALLKNAFLHRPDDRASRPGIPI